MDPDDSAWKNDFLSFIAFLSLYATRILVEDELKGEFKHWRRVTGRLFTNAVLNKVLRDHITKTPYLHLTRAKMLFATHTPVPEGFESTLKDNNVTIKMNADRFITMQPMLTNRSLSVSGAKYQPEEKYDFLSFLTESSRTATERHNMQQLYTEYVKVSQTSRTDEAIGEQFRSEWSKEIEGLDVLLVTKAMLLYATSVPFSEEFYLVKETQTPFSQAEVLLNITKFVQPESKMKSKGEFELTQNDTRGKISNGTYDAKLENAMMDYLKYVAGTNSLKLKKIWEDFIKEYWKGIQLWQMRIYFRQHLAPRIFYLNLDMDTKIKMLLASNTPVTKEQLDILRAHISRNKQYKLEVTVKFKKPPAVFKLPIERKGKITNVDGLVAGVDRIYIKK